MNFFIPRQRKTNFAFNSYLVAKFWLGYIMSKKRQTKPTMSKSSPPRYCKFRRGENKPIHFKQGLLKHFPNNDPTAQRNNAEILTDRKNNGWRELNYQTLSLLRSFTVNSCKAAWLRHVVGIVVMTTRDRKKSFIAVNKMLIFNS